MSPQGYKRAFVKINNSPFCPPSFTSGGTGNRGDESPSLSFHFLPNPLHQLCQRVRKEAEGERKGGRRKKKTGEESGTVPHPETSKNWRTLQLRSGNTSKGWCWLYQSVPGTGASCYVSGPIMAALHTNWLAFNSWMGCKTFKKYLWMAVWVYNLLRGILVGYENLPGSVRCFYVFKKSLQSCVCEKVRTSYWNPYHGKKKI